MDTAAPRRPQEIAVKPMDEIITNTTKIAAANTCFSALSNNSSNNNNNSNSKPQPSTSLERKVRPQKDQALNCPRCNSTSTKFCYYNNYSLTQPRYFCKGCRRYWTEGGSLRNIPVGGGTRKKRRPSSSSSSSLTSPSATKVVKLPDLGGTNPNFRTHEGEAQDLNLVFPSTFSELMQLPSQTTTATSNILQLSAMDLLTGITSNSSRGFVTPFIPMQNSVFPPGFRLQGDFKQPHNFSADGIGIGIGMGMGMGMGTPTGGNLQVQETGGRILFPFEDLKSTTTNATTITTTAAAAASKTANDDHAHQNHTIHDHQNITRDQYGDSTGYWTGILGGAGSW